MDTEARRRPSNYVISLRQSRGRCRPNYSRPTCDATALFNLIRIPRARTKSETVVKSYWYRGKQTERYRVRYRGSGRNSRWLIIIVTQSNGISLVSLYVLESIEFDRDWDKWVTMKSDVTDQSARVAVFIEFWKLLEEVSALWCDRSRSMLVRET